MSTSLRGDGYLLYFRPDGTLFEDFSDGYNEAGRKDGRLYEIVSTGTISGHYRTVRDQILWSRMEPDYEWVLYVDGVEDNRGAGEIFNVQPIYFCDDDELILSYPDDNGTLEFARINDDPGR